MNGSLWQRPGLSEVHGKEAVEHQTASLALRKRAGPPFTDFRPRETSASLKEATNLLLLQQRQLLPAMSEEELCIA